MRPQNQRAIPPTLLVSLLFATLIGLLTACGTDQNPDQGESATFQQVNDTDTIFTPDHLDQIGFKRSRSYELEGLDGATAAIYGFWRISNNQPIDFEVRFYQSHPQAVELGSAPADEGSGKDAILDASKATYKEGIKDRRIIIGKGPGGGGRSGIGPRYGNYAIYGNVVMLCAGSEIEQSLERCQELAEALGNAASQDQ